MTERRKPGFVLRVAVVLGVWTSLAPHSGSAAETDEGQRLFSERIEPVLKKECFGCHSGGAAGAKGGLRVDSQQAMRRGGDSGPAIVPNKPAASLLIDALRHEGGREMPPDKPRLPRQTIEDFIRWVELGAPDPREEQSAGSAPEMKEARKHWSFQPVRKAVPPVVEAHDRVANPIDAFVLERLQREHWRFARPAARQQWIRRVTFDLLGLPPSPEEIDAFVEDESPDAFERVVDRLLASPHYGERWAQHWLDVVRFAESEGYEYDRHIPDAWRFRDYVIDSLNADKPFDRFVIEQIAGDEIEPENTEFLSASIFHRLGAVRRNAGNPDIALSRNEVLTERTDIIGVAFLGMTVGCARCHDHKLEPISQKDYYRLQAYFAATEEHNVSLATPAEQRAWEAETQRIKSEIQRLKKEVQGLTGVEKARLSEKVEELEDALPAPPAIIPATQNAVQRTPIHVLRRGVWENKGDAVGPRPLSVLASDETAELPADIRDPRTRLARWLTAPEHPLTARVLVNRLWQQHFGAGIVRTSNDFGLKGERPTHPELLDWLAATLVEGGWRLKPLHRLIVLSSAYRQSSTADEMHSSITSSSRPADHSPQVIDPDNRFLWKFPRRRLSAEEARDAMLAASGRLNPKVRGPSVIIPVDEELVKLLYKPAQWTVTHDPREHDRRSIYLLAKRNLRLPFFEILDAPALQTSCARRQSSTHAPQALELMNGTLSNDLAEAFARRLQAECGGDRDRLVGRAFRLALGRPPTVAERTLALRFLEDQPVREFALAVFNLNGFLYVP
ncbi:MAG: PSD1 domain-containing protein [Planctomycetaceae bacterium]|nr:PSD1 domain-containing protein [Planctomycetaceae bacterium]